MKAKLNSDGVLVYKCPGCKFSHRVETVTPNPRVGAVWAFNGDLDRPTISPSVNYVGVCHHFVRDGRIEFLSDCTHDLAGQTVDLPEWPAVYPEGDV